VYGPRKAALDIIKEAENVDTTQNLDDILNNKEIPLVFITSVNEAHKSLTLASLAAGKAVMCEKPMATNLEDALEMVEACEQCNGFLQIGFELRYSKLYSQIKKWKDEGLLGDIINIKCDYICSAYPKGLWCSKNESGGIFNHKLSHYVDLPRWWIGDEVIDIYATCAPNIIDYYEVRDNFNATYRFSNGAVSHLTFMMAPAASFTGDITGDVVGQQQGDGHELRYLVVGTKGAAETDVFARTIKRWSFNNTTELFVSTLEETISWTGDEEEAYIHSVFAQTQDIIKRVINGLPPSILPRDAYETMRLCDCAEESANSGAIIILR
jgi:predicted dehydrogenase